MKTDAEHAIDEAHRQLVIARGRDLCVLPSSQTTHTIVVRRLPFLYNSDSSINYFIHYSKLSWTIIISFPPSLCSPSKHFTPEVPLQPQGTFPQWPE